MANLSTNLAQMDDIDSDEEDDDYIPSEAESEEVVSDIEDAEHDTADSTESPKKGKKRMKNPKNSRKKRGSVKSEDESKDIEPTSNGAAQSEESKKVRAESLWADFLSDVTPPKKKETSSKQIARPEMPKKMTVTKVFHFAGEEVKVRKEVDKTEVLGEILKGDNESTPEKNDQTTTSQTAEDSAVQPRRSGLSNILGKITGQKNKLSTLEKSKLDWNQFKTENQLSEVLEQHNRGKDGYLERQAFLERTDLRQFEQEKSLRLKSRNARNF